jgi:PAS domain-containing protein
VRERPRPLTYTAGVLLAAASQVARFPLHPPTLIPFITFVPFIVMSAALGGFGPGLVTTVLCALASLYFATRPVGSFWPDDPQCWLGLGALVFTGLVTGALFERLKRARRRDAAAEEILRQLARERETRQCMLESIIQSSPAAIALLRGPDFRFAMVNPAYQALSPGEPMAGRTVAEVWPAAAPLVAPLLQAVRRSRMAYHAKEFAVPLHHAPGSPPEERYFDLSYVPLAGPAEAAPDDLQILVVAVEVTGYKRSGDALRAAWSELAAIHANAPVALLVIDEEYQVQKVNQRAARFAGRDMADMLGLSPGGAIGCLNAQASPKGCGQGPRAASVRCAWPSLTR